MTIPKEFIGAVIGPGGKIIQGMQAETGAVITIEEIDGMGPVSYTHLDLMPRYSPCHFIGRLSLF